MKAVGSDVQFPALEESVLEFWKTHGIVEKGLQANSGKPAFVFYDGPPFATGLPHYGHILPGTLKDIVPRYWVMKGRYVERRWGWDCHGVPVEFELEKELGLNGLADVKKMGIAAFNEACRKIVTRFTAEWEKTISRTGRWADFKNAYRTMDPGYMESVWWITRQLWDKGLIYEGHRVMPYSWRISTPLSNFEAGLNYKSVQDPAVTVCFKVKEPPSAAGHERFILAWTTTPWTLPTNLALAVGAELDYVELSTADKPGRSYILARSRVATYFDGKTTQELGSWKGTELQGWQYEPLFTHFEARRSQGAFRVLLADHVTDSDGTGIVHTAPAHGEEDFTVCAQNGIEIVDATDAEGRFTDVLPEYKGILFKDADKQIISDLKAKDRLYRHDTYTHNYPFCWRSDTPLMNKAISTWFVRLDPLKEKLIANNQTTHWVPEHLRDGRFGHWLANARDWNISRNRFWGTPLPVWRTEDKSQAICIGSLDELEKLSGQRPQDLHSHFVDEITFACPKTGQIMRRVPEVFDCWFESGSMPFAHRHYPFEDPQSLDAHYPADFIAEGVDQTRGWFYTLSVLSTALFDKAPFKHVIVNGLVLAEDGKKMSKRLKNYPEPMQVLSQHGADALRAYLMSSPASHAEDLRFTESGVKEVVRSVLLPLWNAYSFFVTYAQADGWETKHFNPQVLGKQGNDTDRWVVSRLHSLIASYEQKMEAYHLYAVIPEVLGFIDELTNWYIRLNRRRFWSEDHGTDKAEAHSTLYYVLVAFTKALAPILPFVTEAIYRNLRTADEPESVHLCTFPECNPQWVDRELEGQMALVQKVVSMGRNARNQHRIKTRMPLKEVKVITRVPADQAVIEKYQGLMMAELNVKQVSFSTEESKWVQLSAKANAKVLGPRVGAKMKSILQAVRALDVHAVSEWEASGTRVIEGETLTLDDVVIERTPKVEGAIQTLGSVTVWLDTSTDPLLVAEGNAREFVNRVQKMRKDAGLQVTDRIVVRYQTQDLDLEVALRTHHAWIASEILAQCLEPGTPTGTCVDHEIDGVAIRIGLESKD